MLLTEQDDNTTVTARVGETIEVSLAENPSTGYRWEVEALDNGVVSAGESSFSPTAGGVGAGGTRHMTFRLHHAGSGRIVLALRRRWEPADAALRRWRVTVHAGGGDAPSGPH